jgi:hypothetical protein
MVLAGHFNPNGKEAAMEFTIDCTGDVVVGDTILFTEAVFGGSWKRPSFLGERTITARVLKDSYGVAKQQHTFTLEVISCEGYDALSEDQVIRRKGRNVYRNGTSRMAWADEALRNEARQEKHSRGDIAREIRRIRKEEWA